MRNMELATSQKGAVDSQKNLDAVLRKNEALEEGTLRPAPRPSPSSLSLIAYIASFCLEKGGAGPCDSTVIPLVPSFSVGPL